MALSITQGAGVDRLTQYKDTGEGVDVTGWTLKSEIRKHSGAAVIAEFVIEEEDYTLGKFRLTLSGDVTAALSGGSYWFDVVMSPPVGEPIRSVKEQVIISDGITELD